MAAKVIILLCLVVVGTFGFLEQVDTDSKLVLTSSIEEIGQYRFTPLVITCIFEPSEHPNVAKLMSLTLSRKSFGSTELVNLATVTNKQLKETEELRGKANGSISNEGFTHSSLTVELGLPTEEDSGEYTCASIGFDSSDMTVGSEKSINVGYIEVNTYEIKKCIEGTPRTSLAAVRESLIACGVPQSNWIQAWREITQLYYSQSTGFSLGVSGVFHWQSFYVFYHKLGFVEAEKICANDHKGYPVEINSKEEFDFIKESLGRIRDENHGGRMTQSIFTTGAFYRAPYEKFEFYTHPGAAEMFLGDWGQDEPDWGSMDYDHNWLLVMFGSLAGDLTMADGAKGSGGFICEVSELP